MNTFQHEDGPAVFIEDRDRQKEDALAEFWAKRWNCEIVRFPTLFAIDGYCVRHGRVKAWAEMRFRTCLSTTYKTIVVNLDKFNLIRGAAKLFAIPGLLIIGYADKTGFVDLSKIHEVTIAKLIRRDSNEGIDELVVHMPIQALCLTDWYCQL